MFDKRQILFIVGPTASGKTEVGCKFAKRIDGEIISCDSMQVYRDMAILSEVPPEHFRKEIPHHLVSILPPEEEYSAADFRKRAIGLIKEIQGRGKAVLLVGGSGLYINALVDGLFEGPGADWKIRGELRKEAGEFGSPYLYEQLKRVDTEAAASVHPNDLRRIIRALEIYKVTKVPISKLKERTRGLADEYPVRIFGLSMPRQLLYERIDARVEGMFEAGLVDEVKRLMKRELSFTAREVLGYREVTGFVNGEYDLERTKYLVKRNTRHFAKRQLTWFRHKLRVEWVPAAGALDEIMKEIEKGV